MTTERTNYTGPDGTATYVPHKDVLDVWMTIDGEVVMATLDRHGRMFSRESKTTEEPGFFMSGSFIREHSPKEAARLKSHLRSKGITLPHVMS